MNGPSHDVLISQEQLWPMGWGYNCLVYLRSYKLCRSKFPRYAWGQWKERRKVIQSLAIEIYFIFFKKNSLFERTFFKPFVFITFYEQWHYITFNLHWLQIRFKYQSRSLNFNCNDKFLILQKYWYLPFNYAFSNKQHNELYELKAQSFTTKWKS